MEFKDTPFGRIPENWKTSTISEATEVVTDYVANGSFATLAENVKYKDTEDAAVLIRLVDYNNDFKGDFVYIDEHAYEFLRKSKLFGGEIIISNVGANVGTVFRCPKLPYKMSLAPNAIMVKFKENDDFYFFWLRSPAGQHMLHSIVTGSAQPKFNKTNFREMLVPIPPVEQQKRIVSILQPLEEKIAQNRKINDGKRPAEWPDVSLEKITSLVSRGVAPKYAESTNQVVLNQKCIRNHCIDLSLGREHLPKSINEKWLKCGDLLINSTGEGTLGRTAQVWFVPINMTVDSHVTIVRPKTDLLKMYVGFWGLSNEREIEALHTGTTGQTELPRDRVKAMVLPLPDDMILERFNTVISPITETIVAKQEENRFLAETRDSLLPKLMSGEIDVSAVRI